MTHAQLKTTPGIWRIVLDELGRGWCAAFDGSPYLYRDGSLDSHARDNQSCFWQTPGEVVRMLKRLGFAGRICVLRTVGMSASFEWH